MTEQDVISPKRGVISRPGTGMNKKLSQNMTKADITRNSIVEFEKLEQECIRKFSPNTQMAKASSSSLNQHNA